MSRTNLARLGGLAAIIGGLLHAATNALQLVLISLADTSSSARVALAADGLLLFPLGGLLVALCLATGLTGLYALLNGRSVPRNLGLVLGYLSVLAFVFSVASSVYLSYQATMNADSYSGPFWQAPPKIVIGMTQALLLGGGVLLISIASFRTLILGRWRILPLVLGLLSVTVALFPVLGSYFGWPFVLWNAIHDSLAVLQGLCWVLLGGVLWVYASRREAGDARSTSASRSVERPA